MPNQSDTEPRTTDRSWQALFSIPTSEPFSEDASIASLFDLDCTADVNTFQVGGEQIVEVRATLSFASRDEPRAGILGVEVVLSQSDSVHTSAATRAVSSLRYDRVIWQGRTGLRYRAVQEPPALYVHVWMHGEIDGVERWHAFTRRVQGA